MPGPQTPQFWLPFDIELKLNHLTELSHKLHHQQEKIMGDLTALTAAVTQLQTDTTALTGLITNTVIPDIQKAITLIGSGSDQAAIDALTSTVSSLDAAVTPVTTSLQATDSSLEQGEGGGTPQAKQS